MTDDAASNAPKPARVRMVPTRFQQLAKQKSAISREAALQGGEEALAEMEPEYLVWVDALLQALKQAVEASCASTGMPNRQSAKAYDISNEIRNLGATFEYDAVTRVADSFCELIHRLSDAGIRDEHAMQTHLKALQHVSTPKYKRSEKADLNPLMQALTMLVEHYPEPKGGTVTEAPDPAARAD